MAHSEPILRLPIEDVFISRDMMISSPLPVGTTRSRHAYHQTEPLHLTDRKQLFLASGGACAHPHSRLLSQFLTSASQFFISPSGSWGSGCGSLVNVPSHRAPTSNYSVWSPHRIRRI